LPEFHACTHSSFVAILFPSISPDPVHSRYLIPCRVDCLRFGYVCALAGH
jgi:hypothetical protein